MVKFILISVFYSITMILFLNQQVLSQDKELLYQNELNLRKNQVLKLLGELSQLDTKQLLVFEENFNKTIKMIENALEEQKLYCSGDSSGEQGLVIVASQRQVCIRELKKTYLEVMEETFKMKRKYLMALHKIQLENLESNKKKAALEIEKNF